MKITIEGITEDGTGFDLTEEGKNIEKLAAEKHLSVIFPIKAHIDVRRSGRSIDVEGDLKTAVSLACSRCLKDFEYPVESHFTNCLELGSVRQKEKELTKEDIEVTFFEGDELDTDSILLEEVSLLLPLAPICREDCRGLCPGCGADLNKGPCGCEKKEKTDARFAKLEGFRIK